MSASNKLDGLVELSAEDLAAVGGATHKRRLPIDRNIPAAPPYPGAVASYYGGYGGYGSSPSMFYNPYSYQSSPYMGGLNHSYMAIRRF
jgi:hypothetical protein